MFNVLLEGRKTYIGLIVAFVGVIGGGAWISPAEVEQAVNLILALGGIAMAVYGRAVTKGN